MSLDKIREEVLRTSRSEAEHIVASASKQAKENLESQKENLRKEFEYQYQSRSRIIEDEYSRKLAHFQGAASKELLESKNALLRSIFDEARRTILSWPAIEYAAAMKRFLEKIAGDSGGLLRIHAEDMNTFSELLNEMNRHRENSSALKIDEGNMLHERGGFVFVGDDYEVDATISTIFNDIERSLLPEIARDLADI